MSVTEEKQDRAWLSAVSIAKGDSQIGDAIAVKVPRHFLLRVSAGYTSDRYRKRNVGQHGTPLMAARPP